ASRPAGVWTSGCRRSGRCAWAATTSGASRRANRSTDSELRRARSIASGRRARRNSLPAHLGQRGTAKQEQRLRILEIALARDGSVSPLRRSAIGLEEAVACVRLICVDKLHSAALRSRRSLSQESSVPGPFPKS